MSIDWWADTPPDAFADDPYPVFGEESFTQRPPAGAIYQAGIDRWMALGYNAGEAAGIIAQKRAARRSGNRGLRIVRRIVRYSVIGASMFGAGLMAGYYLTMAKAAVIATAVGVAGGARVTLMVARDLAALGVESKVARLIIASKVGVVFGVLPFSGAAAGLFTYGIRMVRRATVAPWYRFRPIGGAGIGGGFSLRGF